MVFLFIIGKKAPDIHPDQHDNVFRIRCPLCQWQPGKHDRWLCNPGCGHSWNTFDTHGRCPSCEKQWRDTACFRCNEWSPHDDWYETQDSSRRV